MRGECEKGERHGEVVGVIKRCEGTVRRERDMESEEKQLAGKEGR